MIGDVVVDIKRSDGKEYTLGDGVWRIPNDGLENFANLPYDVTAEEIPSYDGAIVTNKRVSSVDRTIKATLAYSPEQAQIRAEAIAFFNPKFTYEVYLTYKGRTRHCQGEQIGCLISTGNIYKQVELTWSILCANPYMMSDGLYDEDLAKVEPRFGFPFMSFLPPDEGEPRLTNTGFITSVHVFDKSVNIINDGDVPSGMRAVITAYDRIVNPSLRIGNGYVKVLKTLNTGDVLELDASSRPPKVTLNGVNAMNLIDRNSTILNMMIEVGETDIEFTADEGELDASIVIYYKKHYLGV